MDHLALLDSFGSTSLDLASSLDEEHDCSLHQPRDKGKAPAHDSADNGDLDLIGDKPAEFGRSGRNQSAFDNANSFQLTNRFAGYSDRKGKAREHSLDSAASLVLDAQDDQYPDLTLASTSSASSRLLHRSLSTTAAQQNGRSSPHSYYHDECTLKRSIREMSSSPSSSPRQHTLPLPRGQACASSSASRLDARASQDIMSSTAHASSSMAHTGVTAANKKRRSLRRSDRQGESSAVAIEHRTSGTPLMGLPPPDALSSFEMHARRASLLVNSSASEPRAFDTSIIYGASAEPSGRAAARTEQANLDLSQRRIAYLDNARSQRSISTMRRRRGFYLRDSDFLRNGPPEETTSHLTRTDSNTSNTSFMSDFARAVDLRLGGRPDSPLDRAFAPNVANAARVDQAHTPLEAPSQRSAPQLPYVRAASPLTVPFAAAESDSSSQTTRQEQMFGSLRRRNLSLVSSRSQHGQQNAPDAVSSRRPLHHHLHSDLVPPPTHLFEDMQRTFGVFPARPASTEVSTHAERGDLRDADRTNFSAARDYAPGRSRGPHLDYRNERSRTAANNAQTVADDFGAVNRPFGHQGNRSPRRSFRSRGEYGSDAQMNELDHAEHIRGARLHAQADSSRERQNTEAHQRRDSVPWRRTHFGLPAPLHFYDRYMATARPRFEPFAESPSVESRQFAVPPRDAVSTFLRRERSEDESSLEYLGRLMSHDSMLDEWMSGDARSPLVRMAMESGTSMADRHPRPGNNPPASTSNTVDYARHLTFDARNFIADEEWAELNSYERLMQLGDRLGTIEVCVPQDMVDALPTCEYGKWNGGSCRQRDNPSPPLAGKGKGKQKVESPATARDTMCPICREDYLDSDLLMSIDLCCHAFHADCIKTWFKTATTCPLCRAEVYDRIGLPALPLQSSPSTSGTAPVGSRQSPWAFDF